MMCLSRRSAHGSHNATRRGARLRRGQAFWSLLFGASSSMRIGGGVASFAKKLLKDWGWHCWMGGTAGWVVWQMAAMLAPLTQYGAAQVGLLGGLMVSLIPVGVARRGGVSQMANTRRGQDSLTDSHGSAQAGKPRADGVPVPAPRRTRYTYMVVLVLVCERGGCSCIPGVLQILWRWRYGIVIMSCGAGGRQRWTIGGSEDVQERGSHMLFLLLVSVLCTLYPG